MNPHDGIPCASAVVSYAILSDTGFAKGIALIQASIVPTRSLRDLGSESTPERKTPTRLRDSKSATADNPVVLLRGCTPIDLRVIVGGISSPRVTWHMQSLRSNNTALTPALFPPVSMFSRLSTNAVGLYRVTATITMASGPTLQYHWHVRFIDLRVPDDPTDVENGGLHIKYGHEFAGTASAGAAFGFTVGVSLLGAADNVHQYDQVTIGILQNLFQKSTDPRCDELHGMYYRCEGFTVKLGELAEPSPPVASPHLDADDSCDEFPFMHSGHVTVQPAVGPIRSIELWDEPGVLLPLYVDSAGSTKRGDWKSKNLSLGAAAKSPTCYALYGVGGHLEFISAVAAFSAEARFNYVVFEQYKFTMEANAMASGNLKKRRPFVDTQELGIPGDSPCFQLESYLTLRTPSDARDAGMETYGPVATSGGGQYRWKNH